MGALQEIFTGNTSTDIVTSNHTWLPYELFVQQQHASNVSKAGPVKIIAMGKTEIDRILDGLGVIHRDRRGITNTGGVSGSLHSSHIRRIPGVGRALEVSP